MKKRRSLADAPGTLESSAYELHDELDDVSRVRGYPRHLLPLRLLAWHCLAVAVVLTFLRITPLSLEHVRQRARRLH